MLALETRLCRRDEDVVAKVMDGEAVIINLSNGTYYSADGVGGFVWGLIDGGVRLDEVAAEVQARYDVDATRARADVLKFVADLLAEDLVTVGEDRGVPREERPAAAARLPYAPPCLNVYRDMEELLALDPPTPGLADLRWKE